MRIAQVLVLVLDTFPRQKRSNYCFISLGKTYFFKGKGFWKFNDLQMRVEHEKQYSSAQFWMACQAERAGRRAPFRALPAPGSTLRSPSSAPLIAANLSISLFSLVIILLNNQFVKCL